MRITLKYALRSGRAFSCAAALLFTAGSAFAQQPQPARDAAGEVGALLDIAAGEYALAVGAGGGGGVIDSLEYEETRLLLEQACRLARTSLAGDGEAGARLLAALDSAEARVGRAASAESVRMAVDEVQRALFDGWGTVALPLPREPLSLRRGAALYRVDCEGCHGAEGRGDGPDSPQDPPAADFTNPALILDSSPARFYQVVSYGIPGTEMEGWRARLSERERWALVAHVSRFGFSDEQRAEGERLFNYERLEPALAGLTDFTTVATLRGTDLLTELATVVGEGTETLSEEELQSLAAYIRTRLESGAGRADPSLIVREVRGELKRSMELHAEGDYEGAIEASVRAYMAFEGIEHDLKARAPGSVAELEADFFAFRESLNDPEADLEPAYAQIDAGLGSAVTRLSAQPSLWSDFFASLIIIVREGVEAILIIGALLTFLVRSGHREQQSSIHAGVLAAIVASLLTALAVQVVFKLAPAHQEVLEGATMLIAVVVLFSVSYWLVSKIEARRWQGYIRNMMNQALSTRSQFALGSVAFIAVFREGVEAVLFYAALFGSAGSRLTVAAGFFTGLGILALIYFAIRQFGMRIPLRPFFAVTSGLLYLMAFVFAGKGIRELQEAGVVGITSVSGMPRIDVLGIYPTAPALFGFGRRG